MTSKPQGCLKILKASGLDFKSRVHRKPRFFVKITPSWENVQHEQQSKTTNAYTKTDVVDSKEPVWNHLVGLYYPDNSHENASDLTIKLDVIETGVALVGKRVTVGDVTVSLQHLRDSTDELALKLQPSGTIIVQFQPLTAVVQDLEHAAEKISPSPELHTVQYNCEEIVRSIKTLMDNIDSFSTIHPYVHIAWITVSSAASIIKGKIETDEAIQDLTEKLRSLYTFTHTLELVRVERVLESVIEKVLNQTIECAIFIQEYAGSGCLAKYSQLLRGTATEKLKEFSDALSNLANDLDTGIATQTALVSLRIESEVGELVLRDRLQPVDHSWHGLSRCQTDTRLDVISDIVRWALNMSPSVAERVFNVWFLHGLAGSGKSTIAATLADFFAMHKRLGAFLSFNRNQEKYRQSSTVIRSLAFALGRFHSEIHRRIKAVTTEFTQIRHLPLVTQFEKLIQEPLIAAFNDEKSELSRQGPIVIIVDALDECGVDGDEDRGDLFSVLVRGSASLPPHIRIIITGRNTNDIRHHFIENNEAPGVHSVMLETDNDQIERYLRHKLNDVWKRRDLSPQPTDAQIKTLVGCAACLFIWAATACRHVDAYAGDERLESLCRGEFMKDGGRRNEEDSLDRLYVYALRDGGDWYRARYKDDARAVLGLIAIAKVPISFQAINKFLESRIRYKQIVAGLASVLETSAATGIVRILHASFRDFLSDEKRCKNICPEKGCSPQCFGRCEEGPWYISPKDSMGNNEEVARKCLSILSSGFGTGSGDTFISVGLGDDFSSDASGILRDDAMIYASAYWTSHICDMSTCPEGFDDLLESFLKTHVLHWLQAMSILGTSLGCASMLEELLLWAAKHVRGGKKDLHELLYDSARFSAFFATSIAEHPAMVYQCVLPFTPTGSHIYRTFHSSSLPTIMGGYLKSWSQSPSRTLESKSRMIYSLSCRNTQVLSTGGDNTHSSDGVVLRQWDIWTGMESMTSQEVDDQAVAVFSSDGKTIWAATLKGTIYAFHALTGRCISSRTMTSYPKDGPPKKPALSASLSMSTGPGDLIWAKVASGLDDNPEQAEPMPTSFARVAFSHNRNTVVLQASEGLLHIVDTASGNPKPYSPLHGRPMHYRYFERLLPSLVFSPADCSFAVATEDGPIEVWCASTGARLNTLTGHTAEVTALRYTSETRLISCSIDGTIRTWSWGGEAIDELPIIDLKPSRDDGFQPLLLNASGSLMASTFQDGTIIIWSLLDPVKEVARFAGHINSISAAAFTEDNAKFISASFLDRTHLWDIYINGPAETSEQLRRHARPVKRITILDHRIKSWREDSTKYWDMMTGRELESAPDKSNELGEDSESMEQFVFADTQEEWTTESFAESVAAREYARNLDRVALTVKATNVQLVKEDDLHLLWLFGAVWTLQQKLDVLGPHQQLLWRLPQEFYLRERKAQAVRSSFLAVGLWNGRVLSVFLPLEHLLKNAKGLPLISTRDSESVEVVQVGGDEGQPPLEVVEPDVPLVPSPGDPPTSVMEDTNLRFTITNPPLLHDVTKERPRWTTKH